jgi:hypothetical protein
MNRLLGAILFIVCLASSAMPGKAQAAPPTFQGVSVIAAAANGAADPTVTLPAHAADDVFLLVTVVRSGTATVATPAGWTQIGATTVRAATATYQFFWRRAVSAAETNPLIDRTGTTGDVFARVVSYRGAIATGDPWEVKGAITTGTADPSVITGITTLTANSLVVAAVAGEDDNNASIITTGTNPAAYTALYAESPTGADGVITFSYAARTAAGATGNVSVNWNTAIPIGFGGIVLALQPPNPRGTVFYFHDATTPDIGTLPVATTSAITPNVTATGAGTNRDMNQTLGVLAVSPNLTTLAVTTLQRNWFRRFVSRPLAAQTLPTGRWAIEGVAFEANIASNMLVWGAVLKVWRPSTGAVVATLLDNPQLGSVEPGTAATLITTNTTSIAGVAVNDGDVLLVELWAANTQGGATARLNTIRYDGTTESSTATPASYLEAPGTIVFHRGVYQSAYRLFDNADSTNVGAVLAAQDTPATLGATGASFRLRKLLHVADINLAVSGQAFKLQFAAKGGGTCAAPAGAYADVTAATVIAYNNNPTPADGANLTANGADPTHVAHTVVNQSYEELNNFTNAVAAINAGQDGKWDFALRDNGAPASTTYCFRVVKDTGVALDAYLAYPEITTAVAAPSPPDSFNAVEVAANAVTGRIFTKLRSANFTLDIVAIQGGAQLNTFSEAVTIDVVTGGSAGANCGGAVVSTIAGPTDVTLANGRVTTANINVATAYPNVRVRIRYPVGGPYTITTCSSDNFSIKPTAFSITSTDATNTGTGVGTTIKTGATFNLTAAGGAGYTGTPGTNFTGNVTGTPTAGTLGPVGAGFLVADGAGTASGTFYYGEVGNFGLAVDAVRDTSFTSVDLAGTDCVASSTSDPGGGPYGCWVGSNAVTQSTGVSGFGRFIPDNFNVAYTTPPIFGTTCGTFTYVGTLFTYPGSTGIMTVTARAGTANSLGDATTVNYAGSYVKLTTAALNVAPYDTKAARYTRFDALNPSPTPALDHTGLPATATDPTVGAFASGVGTLTFSAGTGLLFTRDTATPNAPFNADIALALNVVDSDLVAFAGNPASFGAATAGNGISFSGGKAMRYGRLRLANANGSQLVPLSMLMETQYWNGSSFITNAEDNCTSLAAANVGLGNYAANLQAGETTPSIAAGNFSKGRKTLTLSPSGAANNGSVDVVLNLGTTTTIDSCLTWLPSAPTPSGASLGHLRGRWCGATHTKDPTARATFGAHRGSEEVIHIRENFQ